MNIRGEKYIFFWQMSHSEKIECFLRSKKCVAKLLYIPVSDSDLLLFRSTLKEITPLGVLGKVGIGMCGQKKKVPFWPLRFTIGPFLQNAKFLMNFSFSLSIGCEEVLLHPN